MVDDADVENVVQIALGEDVGIAQHLLDGLRSLLGEMHGARFLVLLEGRLVAHQDAHDVIDMAVELGAVVGRSRDDQRRARLVDEDAVDLVDDRVAERPLHHVLEAILHVVAQVVEAELVVGAVGDVAGVGGRALAVGQACTMTPVVRPRKP